MDVSARVIIHPISSELDFINNEFMERITKIGIVISDVWIEEGKVFVAGYGPKSVVGQQDPNFWIGKIKEEEAIYCTF